MACSGCGKKTGLISTIAQYAAAKLLGKNAPEDLREKRKFLCINCGEVERNEKGESMRMRLFRKHGTKFYCGAPRLEMIVRDEQFSGCGCDLDDKVAYLGSACPNGHWGPGNFLQTHPD